MKIIKKKIHDKKSRAIMLEGVNELADVVGSTMGAKGRNVLLDKEYGAPLVINDGVTIAKEIFFEDQLKNLAAQLIKDAAIRTNETAGDGTTGATVLAREILREGWAAVEGGANPVQLRRELEDAAKKLETKLKESATAITTEAQVIQIASISVQDPEAGKLIGETMFKVGKYGAVTIKNSLKPGIYAEREGGMSIEGALIGGVVEQEDRWEAKLENAKVLILQDSLEDHEFETKWVPFSRQFATGETLPNGDTRVKEVHVPVLLVIAEKLSRRIIMMMNANKEFVKWVWFRPATAAKNMKEIYKDLSAIVGGKIVNEEEGVPLKSLSIADMGMVDLAVVDRHGCLITISPEKLENDRYLDRCNAVKEQMENAEDEVEQEQIKERYANLVGGVASIKVASATTQDTNEFRLRIEDAINASRSAMEEGIVAGGGVALLNASEVLTVATDGEKVLKKACEAAIRQILHNAGYEPDRIDKTIKELRKTEGKGVDVLTDEILNMQEAGLIDPLKVIRLSLLNATSVAGLLITSEYTVTNEEDDNAAVKRFFTQKD